MSTVMIFALTLPTSPVDPVPMEIQFKDLPSGAFEASMAVASVGQGATGNADWELTNEVLRRTIVSIDGVPTSYADLQGGLLAQRLGTTRRLVAVRQHISRTLLGSVGAPEGEVRLVSVGSSPTATSSKNGV